MTQIHPRRIVDPQAELDPSVEVGAYASSARTCGSARGTTIGAALRDRRPHDDRPRQPDLPVRLDRRGAAGQEVRAASRRELEIGDRNTIREFCTFNLGTAQDGGVTRVGNDNWIMAYVHIAHDCQVGNHTILANNAHAGRPRRKSATGSIVGGLTGVHQFVAHRRARA